MFNYISKGLMLETAGGLYLAQPCDYRLRSGSGLGGRSKGGLRDSTLDCRKTYIGLER